MQKLLIEFNLYNEYVEWFKESFGLYPNVTLPIPETKPITLEQHLIFLRKKDPQYYAKKYLNKIITFEEYINGETLDRD